MKTIWKRFSQERPVPGQTIFINFDGSEHQRTAFVCERDNSRYQLVGDSTTFPLHPNFTWCYPEDQEQIKVEFEIKEEDRSAAMEKLIDDYFFPDLDKVNIGSLFVLGLDDDDLIDEDFEYDPEDLLDLKYDHDAEPQVTPTPGREPRNPKNVAASTKVPLSTLPIAVLCEVAGALGEGMIQYGKHNWYGDKIETAEYYDAALRHIFASLAGQDIDPKSGIDHISKAIAGLMVLRDAVIQGNAIDTRPPPTINKPIEEANERFQRIREETPDCCRHFDRESIRRRCSQ